MDEREASEIRRVFEAQQARRWAVAQTSAEERVAKLRALRAAILERREALSAAVHADFRKSAAELELTELYPVLEEIEHVISHLHDWMEPERAATPLVLAGTRSVIRHEPRGVVLVMSPWNYPFNLLFMPAIAAIAAGNCVILKPSNKTAHLADEAAKLIRATFREDEVAIFTGGHDVSDVLLELPFDHIVFTGSTSIGKKVMAAASAHLATVTLELGGKSPVIVDASADLEEAARRVMWGKCLNSGQTCIAPDYALVDAKVHDAFVDACVRAVERYYGASEEARQKSEDFARLIDDHAFRRVSGLVERSVAAGAKARIGGRWDASERYVAPTILTDVTPSMPIMGEEIFGPVLPILRVESVDAATHYVRAHDKPLALYLFARDRAVIERVLSTTTSGGCVVNDVFLHVANPHLPFGGVGASGQGNYHGIHGFRTLSHARATLENRGATAVPVFYPPYADLRSRIGQRVLRALE